MSVEITHIRLSVGGTLHKHITHVAWRNSGGSGSGADTRAEMVAWIDKGNKAYVGSGSQKVEVGVVEPDEGSKYLRTHADGKWNNNLLSLPRF